MNDKQKLALKELADVMEKHGITIESNGAVWIDIEEGGTLWADDGPVGAEYIREALKE